MKGEFPGHSSSSIFAIEFLQERNTPEWLKMLSVSRLRVSPLDLAPECLPPPSPIFGRCATRVVTRAARPHHQLKFLVPCFQTAIIGFLFLNPPRNYKASNVLDTRTQYIFH